MQDSYKEARKHGHNSNYLYMIVTNLDYIIFVLNLDYTTEFVSVNYSFISQLYCISYGKIALYVYVLN